MNVRAFTASIMKLLAVLTATAIVLAGCGVERDSTTDELLSAVPALIREAFVTTPSDSAAEVSGVAVYHGADDSHWLITASATSNTLRIHDATTGAFLRTVGGTGTGIGELRGPAGLEVLGDSVLLVVERDNARVQGFHLPDFTSVGVFGDRLLRRPSSITASFDAKSYVVYIADNPGTANEQTPDSAAKPRVKQFLLSVRRGELTAIHWKTVGDTTGQGALDTIGSIAVDQAHDRLLIADKNDVKVYDLAGRFTGQVLERMSFREQATGIALYACGKDDGYWIATATGDSASTFHVFDRATLSHAGAFSGTGSRQARSVAATDRAVGRFAHGALFGSHLGASVSATGWADIAAALNLRQECSK
jgi:3-phytase